MSTSLTRYQPQPPLGPARGVEIRSIGDLQQFAGMAAESGLFKDLKGAAQAAIKIQRGLELGLAPMEAMSSLHVMEGKVTMSSQLMAALVKRAGYRYQTVEHSYERCELRWFDPQGRELGCSSFSMDDARKAGIANRPNWSKYAREMLFARAISQGARWHAPEVLLGCYLPEEMEPAAAPPIQSRPDLQRVEECPECGGVPCTCVPDEEVQERRNRAYRRLHAVGAELGLDHEGLRDLLGVSSMATSCTTREIEGAAELLLAPDLDRLRDVWEMVGSLGLSARLQGVKDWAKGRL